jgi:hypothetical protein
MRHLTTRNKIAVAAVVAALTASVAYADVITLSCSVTLGGEHVPEAQAVETVVIDLDAHTVQGPAGTVNISVEKSTLITWMDPYETTKCQQGIVDRVTGEYQNQLWNNNCQDIDAAFKDRFQRWVPELIETWRGFCKPAKQLF